VELYDEHDLAGAEVEFARAYALAKNFRILYNLGQVARERHDYAAALQFFFRYLREGGIQIAPDRELAVEDEIDKLRQRVGRLTIVYEGPDAEVLVDNVVVGRTPLLGPLTVNLGRRHIELKPPQGAPLASDVDIAGEDTVTLRLAPKAAAATLSSRKKSRGNVVDVDAQASTPAAQGNAWLAWTFTGVATVATGIAGLVAYEASNSLKDLRQSYPVSRDELDAKQRWTRSAGWVTDGLLAGTAVLAAVSIYLTLAPPVEHPPRISVGWAWPGLARLRGSF
jgi:hypothetical protein